MITKNTIEVLAKLSRLEFTDSEKELLKNELQEIIDFVGDLQKVNTDDVVENAAFADSEHNLREDVVGNSFTPEQAVVNAEVKEDGTFSVPAVIE